MAVYRLANNNYTFPPAEMAEQDGLLAVGGDLSPQRLISAYMSGVFPWFCYDDAYFWYSPDPRMVLFPSELKVHKSMRSVFNQHKFRYSLDTCFPDVMKACAETIRSDHEGTWIGEDFIAAYTELHEMGIAHSVEVWSGEKLVGGLYGLAIGKIFFGESMFAQMPNASKAGFITLVRALQQAGFTLIDCQQQTEHLATLGARGIPREQFLDILSVNSYATTRPGKWSFDEAYQLT
ncbi:MAG: leucyl/phenylalanyl-tRNA--protein transferase [Saprospiraceae bacterium]|nr:leucyl/phenylalanyl-tRNA--protein transferase [Saprospiraceae bacterium]